MIPGQKTIYNIKSIDGIWSNIDIYNTVTKTRIDAEFIKDLSIDYVAMNAEVNYNIGDLDTRTLVNLAPDRQPDITEFIKYDGPNLDYQYSDHICVKVEFNISPTALSQKNVATKGMREFGNIVNQLGNPPAALAPALVQSPFQIRKAQGQALALAQALAQGKGQGQAQALAQGQAQALAQAVSAKQGTKFGGSRKKRVRRTKKKRNYNITNI